MTECSRPAQPLSAQDLVYNVTTNNNNNNKKMKIELLSTQENYKLGIKNTTLNNIFRKSDY